MDQVKIGKFISELRKEMHLTQQQLADKLSVSYKTISKWECGNGLPEVSLMIPLCEILGITVNELLSGCKIENKEIKNKADENLIKLLRTKQKEYKLRRLIINILTCVFFTITCFIFCYKENQSIAYSLLVSLIPFSIMVYRIYFIINPYKKNPNHL